jgi:hypothetical protein
LPSFWGGPRSSQKSPSPNFRQFITQNYGVFLFEAKWFCSL